MQAICTQVLLTILIDKDLICFDHEVLYLSSAVTTCGNIPVVNVHFIPQLCVGFSEKTRIKSLRSYSSTFTAITFGFADSLFGITIVSIPFLYEEVILSWLISTLARDTFLSKEKLFIPRT